MSPGARGVGGGLGEGIQEPERSFCLGSWACGRRGLLVRRPLAPCAAAAAGFGRRVGARALGAACVPGRGRRQRLGRLAEAAGGARDARSAAGLWACVRVAALVCRFTADPLPLRCVGCCTGDAQGGSWRGQEASIGWSGVRRASRNVLEVLAESARRVKPPYGRGLVAPLKGRVKAAAVRRCEMSEQRSPGCSPLRMRVLDGSPISSGSRSCCRARDSVCGSTCQRGR